MVDVVTDTAVRSGGAKRDAILDATQAIMVEKGYGAVSVRSVAAAAGVKPAVVQHYFATMEALFLATYRRAADASLDQQVAALAADRPLSALWTVSTDAGRTALAIEFMALANHRKAIRSEIARYAERGRVLQAAALARLLPDAGDGRGLSLLIAGAARALVMEEALGVTTGHAEARAMIGRWIEEAEAPRSERPAGHRD